MIWVDVDGVVADFDGHHEKLFGYRPQRWPQKEKVDWAAIAATKTFFLDLPAMPLAYTLVRYVDECGLGIGFLTGVPKQVDASDNQKRTWLGKRWPGIKVQCCRSRDKCLHGEPGDILIDDYLKYAHLWTGMGGVFIHHTGVHNTIRQLHTRGIRPLC